jgi:hypothetical protein
MATFDPVGAYRQGRDLSVQRQLQLGAYNEQLFTKLAGEYDKAIGFEQGQLLEDVNGLAQSYGSGQIPEGAQFESAEEFSNFFNDFQARADKGNIKASDFISVYGTQQGIKKLNNMGFGSAVLGLGKELDENNSEFNDKDELVPYVRTADPNRGLRGQVYSAPMTVGGKSVRDIIKEFGPGGMEDYGVSLDLNTINDAFDLYKRDITIRGGGDPRVALLGGYSGIQWFDPKAREQREEALVGQEEVAAAPTPSGQDTQTTIIPGTAVRGTTPAPTPAPTPSPYQPGEYGQKAIDMVDGLEKQPAAPTAGPRSLNLQVSMKQQLGEGFYQDPTKLPGNLTSEEWDRYSLNEKAALKQNIQNYSNFELDKALKTTQEDFLQQARQSRDIPGFKQEDYEKLQSTGDYYKKNQKVVKEALIADPALYAEYKQDPVAFAAKYADINILKPKNIDASSRKIINNAGQDVKSGGFSKQDVSNFTTAIASGDPNQVLQVANQIIGSGQVSSKNQQGLVTILQNADNNLGKLDQANRARVALNILASLTPEQRNGAFAQNLMNMVDYGKLTGVQAAKQALDTAKYVLDVEKFKQAGLGLSPEGNKTLDLFNAIVDFDDWTDQDFRDFGSKVSIQMKLALGSDKKGDLLAATSSAQRLIDEYVASKAQPGILKEIFTLFFAANPTAGGFDLSPNLVALDGKGKPTTNREEVTQFGVYREGTNELIGSTFDAFDVKNDLDVIGLEIFYQAMLDKAVQRARGGR